MQHLILLHGAIGSSEQLKPLANALENDFIVHLINFSGHGGKPIPDTKFSIALFANDVIKYMTENEIEQANIFGYSMGGYVAMYLAKHHLENINRVITLATKFYWDEVVAAKEIKMVNANTIQEKVPAFAQQLTIRHFPNDWKKVLEKTSELLTELGINNTLQLDDYLSVHTPCLILLGDRDEMVTFDETITVYKQLPIAQLGILPNTPHQLEQVNLPFLLFSIRQYLNA